MGIIGVGVGINATISVESDTKLRLGGAAIVGIVGIVINIFSAIVTVLVKRYHYRFPSEVSRQYTIGTSIKRAFTINFRTICFGSFFEALIKALRSSTKDNRRKSILSCIFKCILWMIDDFIGYLNEWTFIYAALTGQGFVQGS
ncbi:unnamed protein product [Rotaria sordida]|uniref:Choline transporter-like protein n=1 Tax=Rotaria sordida TaxID=392033 RepID=A0A815JYD7_9BILA|nr:unnamed protein product [Rotaria sordida]